MTLMLMMMGGECKEGCDRRQADVARCQQRFPPPHPPIPLLQPILTIHLLADPHLHDVPQQTHSYVDVFKMLI